jgi:UDP-2,3-diacylglucosamine pyrophosphatase LpxH
VNAHLNKNLSYRAIWISDVHLGTPGAQVTPLLEFLKHTECKTLYLVGDIIDGWQLKKRFFLASKAQRCNSKNSP